jgi:hypothetical protein
MNQQTLENKFKEAAASASVTELIQHLKSANKRLPAFALPDTIDCVDCLGQIVRTHTNASDETVNAAMRLVSAALVNALTDHTITIVSEEGREDGEL